MDNKEHKCIFIGYKNGMKGCKLWGLVTRKNVYIQESLIFREVGGTSRIEEGQREKEP
jgi:hypothetical protein